MTVRRFDSHAEADRHDLEYWMQTPPSERVLHTWRLSEEFWRLRGECRDEPGLCRSVASSARAVTSVDASAQSILRIRDQDV
jgi:hypothetical protein